MGGSSSETSSEISDHQEVHDDYAGTKRPYDCIFCKRGFTNSRALGGHMNIHRKERTNAKKGTPNSSLPKSFTNKESMATPFIPEASSSRYYCILESRSNYDMYFRPSAPNHINHQPAYNFQYEFLNPRSQSIRNQELLGANLSLQIGPNDVDTDQVGRGIQEDGERVDLELRLRHDPYSNY